MERAERQRLNEQLARLAHGDRDAFHPVFLALQPIVRRFAARQVPPDEAEDVAQEALVKVFAQAARFDPEKDAVGGTLGCMLMGSIGVAVLLPGLAFGLAPMLVLRRA